MEWSQTSRSVSQFVDRWLCTLLCYVRESFLEALAWSGNCDIGAIRRFSPGCTWWRPSPSYDRREQETTESLLSVGLGKQFFRGESVTPVLSVLSSRRLISVTQCQPTHTTEDVQNEKWVQTTAVGTDDSWGGSYSRVNDLSLSVFLNFKPHLLG